MRDKKKKPGRKVFVIPHTSVIRLVTNNAKITNIPEGSSVLHAYNEEQGGSLALVVQSDTFPECVEGTLYERVPAVIEEVDE